MLDHTLFDSDDHDIIMHRDAHFEGSFSTMMTHYKEGRKSAVLDISLERLAQLQEYEIQSHTNLSSFLTDEEKAKVEESKEIYKELHKMNHPLKELILSEDDSIDLTPVFKKDLEKSLKLLLELLKTEHFYDPLFPGFGKSPFSAMKILGEFGDKRAMIVLFESLNHGDFFDEEIAIQALKKIGEPARDFLIKVLQGKPHTSDNINAALALIGFKDDPIVLDAALKLLSEIDFQKETFLAEYLILLCENLRDLKTQEIFKNLAKKQGLPHLIRKDMETIIESWKELKEKT